MRSRSRHSGRQESLSLCHPGTKGQVGGEGGLDDRDGVSRDKCEQGCGIPSAG